jgi:2-oxoglutarate dehydrogenase E1 component
MTPKSLLRHKEAVSDLEDLSDGAFQTFIGDVHTEDASNIERIVFCSGKVYYDLHEKRVADGIHNVAIVRIEQLYPFPEVDMQATLKMYPNIKHAVWCQEEPMNQGAWYASQHHMRRVLHRVFPDLYLAYTGREASAAAAAGYMSLHVRQQEQLVHDALSGTNES